MEPKRAQYAKLPCYIHFLLSSRGPPSIHKERGAIGLDLDHKKRVLIAEPMTGTGSERVLIDTGASTWLNLRILAMSRRFDRMTEKDCGLRETIGDLKTL
jgi:hypothetical protein